VPLLAYMIYYLDKPSFFLFRGTYTNLHSLLPHSRLLLTLWCCNGDALLLRDLLCGGSADTIALLLVCLRCVVRARRCVEKDACVVLP